MPTCPNGHDSAGGDFCDVCGIRMGGPAGPPAAPAPGEAAAPTTEKCPRCGIIRSGQYCEACGYDFESPAAPTAGAAGEPAVAAVRPPGAAAPPSAPASASAAQAEAAAGAAATRGGVAVDGEQAAGWTAVVAADPAYYDSVIAAGGPDAATIQFPAYCPQRRFSLAGPQMRIGRRSVSRGLEPEIDLSGPPTDPGVSRLHAVLIAQPGGGWAILDPGSENGTLVNGNQIATGAQVPLNDGDRIHLGAWTVITFAAAG